MLSAAVRGIPRRLEFVREVCAGSVGRDGANAYRVTTTLTREQHEALERLARDTGVKVAWLVRRGVVLILEQGNQGHVREAGRQP